MMSSCGQGRQIRSNFCVILEDLGKQVVLSFNSVIEFEGLVLLWCCQVTAKYSGHSVG